ncbi:MAG: hypothetical protein U5K84_06205 [Alkalibacterium sp.]|nr:hypothetical protein [Alkalibacterium sp.]
MKERGDNNVGWRRKGSWMVKAKKHPLLFLVPVTIIGVSSLAFLLFPGRKKADCRR